MALKRLRKAAVLLLAVLVFAMAPATAFAEGEASEILVEQCVADAPGYGLYFYPTDSLGNIVYGLSLDKMQWTVKYGEEEFEVRSLENVKEEGSTYIIMVNTSSAFTDGEYLHSVQEGLAQWAGALGPKDKLVVKAYCDKIETVLDGSVTNDAEVKNALEKIKITVQDADTYAAVKDAVSTSASLGSDYPARHVIIMVDDGNFLTEKDISAAELSDIVKSSGLPIYGVCRNYNENVQLQFAEFLWPTGGILFSTVGYEPGYVLGEMHSWLDSAYLLSMYSAELSPSSAMKLSAKAEVEGTVLEAERTLVIRQTGEDANKPKVMSAEVEGNDTIKLNFSVDVAGADKTDSYKLVSGETGEEVEILSAEYDSAAFSAVLTVAKLKPGMYKLTAGKVHARVSEKNLLVYPDGLGYISLECSGDSTGIIIAAAAAVLLIAAAVVLVIMKKKKEKERAEAEQRRKAEELEKQKAAQAAEEERRQQHRVEGSDKLPVTVSMVLPNSDKRQIKVLVGENFTVGRQGCDLTVDDSTMSRKHFSLSFKAGVMVISDLGSGNGTFVNGIKIDKPRSLLPGDVVTAGKTKISLSV